MNTWFDFVDKNCLLAVYIDENDTSKFLVGSIWGADGKWIGLDLYSEESVADGICICAGDSVYRIERESEYLKGMRVPDGVSEKCDSDMWNVFLDSAELNKDVIQITFNDKRRKLYGIPIRHMKDCVVLCRIYVNGNIGNEISVNKSDIKLIVSRSKTEQKIKAEMAKKEGQKSCGVYTER